MLEVPGKELGSGRVSGSLERSKMDPDQAHIVLVPGKGGGDKSDTVKNDLEVEGKKKNGLGIWTDWAVAEAKLNLTGVQPITKKERFKNIDQLGQ